MTAAPPPDDAFPPLPGAAEPRIAAGRVWAKMRTALPVAGTGPDTPTSSQGPAPELVPQPTAMAAAVCPAPSSPQGGDTLEKSIPGGSEPPLPTTPPVPPAASVPPSQPEPTTPTTPTAPTSPTTATTPTATNSATHDNKGKTHKSRAPASPPPGTAPNSERTAPCLPGAVQGGSGASARPKATSPAPSVPAAAPQASGQTGFFDVIVGPRSPDEEPVLDASVVQALRSPKDRKFLLQLEAHIISNVECEKIERIRLSTPIPPVLRFLVHLLADYYGLQRVVEQKPGEKEKASMTLLRTPKSRIPERTLAIICEEEDRKLEVPTILSGGPGAALNASREAPGGAGAVREEDAQDAEDQLTEASSSEGSPQKTKLVVEGIARPAASARGSASSAAAPPATPAVAAGPVGASAIPRPTVMAQRAPQSAPVTQTQTFPAQPQGLLPGGPSPLPCGDARPQITGRQLWEPPGGLGGRGGQNRGAGNGRNRGGNNNGNGNGGGGNGGGRGNAGAQMLSAQPVGGQLLTGQPVSGGGGLAAPWAAPSLQQAQVQQQQQQQQQPQQQVQAQAQPLVPGQVRLRQRTPPPELPAKELSGEFYDGPGFSGSGAESPLVDFVDQPARSLSPEQSNPTSEDEELISRPAPVVLPGKIKIMQRQGAPPEDRRLRVLEKGDGSKRDVTRMSLEEREQMYEEARARIFGAAAAGSAGGGSGGEGEAEDVQKGDDDPTAARRAALEMRLAQAKMHDKMDPAYRRGLRQPPGQGRGRGSNPGVQGAAVAPGRGAADPRGLRGGNVDMNLPVGASNFQGFIGGPAEGYPMPPGAVGSKASAPGMWRGPFPGAPMPMAAAGLTAQQQQALQASFQQLGQQQVLQAMMPVGAPVILQQLTPQQQAALGAWGAPFPGAPMQLAGAGLTAQQQQALQASFQQLGQQQVLQAMMPVGAAMSLQQLTPQQQQDMQFAAARERQKAAMEFSLQHSRKDQRREYALGDPTSLRRDLPMNGPCGMQASGQDLSRGFEEVPDFCDEADFEARAFL